MIRESGQGGFGLRVGRTCATARSIKGNWPQRGVTMRTRLTIPFAMLLLLSSPAASIGGAAEKVPILYSTDLHHPHEDPDDHCPSSTSSSRNLASRISASV